MNPDNSPQNQTPTPGTDPAGTPVQPVTPPPAASPQPAPAAPVDPFATPTTPTPMPGSTTVHGPGSRKGLVVAVMVVAVAIIAALVYMVVVAGQ